MKYRIVKRNRSPGGYETGWDWFYAQVKILGIWIDCRFLFLSDGSRSPYLSDVERWVKSKLKQSPGNPYEEQVVEVYD